MTINIDSIEVVIDTEVNRNMTIITWSLIGREIDWAMTVNIDSLEYDVVI